MNDDKKSSPTLEMVRLQKLAESGHKESMLQLAVECSDGDDTIAVVREIAERRIIGLLNLPVLKPCSLLRECM